MNFEQMASNMRTGQSLIPSSQLVQFLYVWYGKKLDFVCIPALLLSYQ